MLCGSGSGSAVPNTTGLLTPPVEDAPHTAVQGGAQFALTKTGLHSVMTSANVTCRVLLIAFSRATTLPSELELTLRGSSVVDGAKLYSDRGAVTANSAISVPSETLTASARAPSVAPLRTRFAAGASPACTRAFNSCSWVASRNVVPSPAQPTAVYTTEGFVTPAAAATSPASDTDEGCWEKSSGIASGMQPPSKMRVEAVFAEGCTNGVLVGVAVPVREGVTVSAGVDETDEVSEDEGVDVSEDVSVGDDVPDTEDVGEDVGVSVFVGEDVSVDELEAVLDAVDDTDAVFVGDVDTEDVADDDDEIDAVLVLVTDAEDVGVPDAEEA